LKFLQKYYDENKIEQRERSLWTKNEIEEPIKTSCRFAMRDYMSDQEVSRKVLESLYLFGVSFIDGVQPTQHNTEFVIRQLFPIHRTFFGEMWTFSDEKRDHSDSAYTNCKLI
jgi:trimethyllysine dioxygenase